MERGEDSLDSEINQVDKHRSTEREAAVSNPGRTNFQSGSLNN